MAIPSASNPTVGDRIEFEGGVELRVGSGAPSHSAKKGSLYVRTDGSSTSTRLYVNTDGGTTWTNFTSAA